jgi:hypothetical protein
MSPIRTAGAHDFRTSPTGYDAATHPQAAQASKPPATEAPVGAKPPTGPSPRSAQRATRGHHQPQPAQGGKGRSPTPPVRSARPPGGPRRRRSRPVRCAGRRLTAAIGIPPVAWCVRRVAGVIAEAYRIGHAGRERWPHSVIGGTWVSEIWPHPLWPPRYCLKHGLGSTGMSPAQNEPDVFAQPWYLRAMNLIAASVGAIFVLGVALDRPSPSPALIALTGAGAAACMLFGVRAMLAQVVVTSDSVRYRGIVGTRTIPLSQVLGFQRDPSWLALLAGDVPSLLWRREDGTVATTILWCFVISRRARVGRGSTYEVRDALRLALDPYIQRNL